MRSCSECGHLTDDDANFCDQCGARLRTEPPPVVAPAPVEQERTLGSRLWVWLLGALALMLAIALGAVLVFIEPEPETDDAADDAAAGDAGSEGSDQQVRPAPDPADVLAATGSTRLRLLVSRCAGCEITAVPADGNDPQIATVDSGSVEFALPTASTLALGFTVSHPDGFGSQDGPNAIVLAPTGVAAGTAVAVSDVIGVDTVSVCWAGTLAADATITVAVEIFAKGAGDGGLRAWADPAQPVTSAATAPDADGTVQASGLNGCTIPGGTDS
jgi:hypothetical protein